MDLSQDLADATIVSNQGSRSLLVICINRCEIFRILRQGYEKSIQRNLELANKLVLYAQSTIMVISGQLVNKQPKMESLDCSGTHNLKVSR